MKLSRTLSFLACFLLFAQITTAQIIPEKKPTDDPAKLKKDAVAFLRETMADVNNLRTLENRISFSAELASLMWFHDEKEAKAMFIAASVDFKQLLMQFDQQANGLGESEEGENYRGGMFADITDRSRLYRRFQTAMQVRQQMAMSLAEHDAEVALTFFSDSLQALTNPGFRKQMESRDEHFEVQLMTQIAKTNASKATQFAVKAVEKGVKYQHLELLKKIYEKDPEKGAEFAAAIFNRFKKDELKGDDYWVLSSFMTITGDALAASGKEGGKKPLLTQSEMRDVADVFAQSLLNNSDEESPGGLQYLDVIEKYNPGRAAQLRAKFRGRGSGPNSGAAFSAANRAVNASRTGSNSNSGGSSHQRDQEEREKAEKQLQEDVAKLGSKELPKEEREKIITQARRILSQTPGKDKKIVGLSALAAQVRKVGDKELAAEIMRDAQSLISPMPKNYQDFILTWMLASGYAEVDPEKAFPLLEETIMRANDTLSAFIKVGEFIDIAGEIIDEGEVQVGAFGGQMIRGLTSELGMADATLRALAKTDFNKTKNLTSRFDRSEVRILAKMMILRAVLGEKKVAEKPEGDPDIGLVLN